jgi:LytS/YehU family sensor histidine kinase
MKKIYNTNWLLVTMILAALVPVVFIIYDVVFTDDNSVILLGNYHPSIAILFFSYYLFLIGIGVYWFTNQVISIKRLKNEKITSELMLLKSQVNPHFFFNILNNLYGLVSKDSIKAQELILKLSDMMRYSIYEGEKELVTLNQEVEYMKNYMEIHKMRYHKHIDLDFKCNINENCKVVPLLFIILLENAFKHGVENLRENANVKVNMTSSNNEINFVIENNYDNTEIEKTIPGIGLKNLKRRLELTYPNKHALIFTKFENVYKAQLILQTI